MSDAELIKSFFMVAMKESIERELGPPIKLTIDEAKGVVNAQGSFAGREWDMSELVKNIKIMVGGL